MTLPSGDSSKVPPALEADGPGVSVVCRTCRAWWAEAARDRADVGLGLAAELLAAG